jgi:hypothetical protein
VDTREPGVAGRSACSAGYAATTLIWDLRSAAQFLAGYAVFELEWLRRARHPDPGWALQSVENDLAAAAGKLIESDRDVRVLWDGHLPLAEAVSLDASET